MQVETFEQTEVVGGKLEDENSPEALEIIESLGLQGQKKMTKESEGGVITRCPYRTMNIKELRVYECLFPQKTEIQKYQASMIPLRVLQVAAHAKSLDLFDRIEVWGEISKPRDPILVGIKKTDSWSHDNYILARWGDALESFEVLFERAKAVTKEHFKAKAEKTRAECEIILASLDSQVMQQMDGGFVHIPG